jgi:hypothetical protein
MVVIYVLDVPEFRPVIDTCRDKPDCVITAPAKGYWRVTSATEIVLNRRQMQMKPAVWYGLFTGGLNGEIAEFGRDEVRVIGTNKGL